MKVREYSVNRAFHRITVKKTLCKMTVEMSAKSGN